MTAKALLAGAGQCDITPVIGTPMNGDFLPNRAATIHDRLFAKCLALQSGDFTLLFVVVDTCYMQDDFVRPLRKDVSETYRLPPENILFAATHTHSGGSLAGLFLTPPDVAYRSFTHNQVLDCVGQSLSRLRPAKISFGAVMVPEHVVNRRYLMTAASENINPVTGAPEKVKTNPVGQQKNIVERLGTTDSELSYLAVSDHEGRIMSVLANYSLHYVGDFPAGIISADYFGYFSRHVASRLSVSDDFVAILTNGTSGDVNIWDFLNEDRYPEGEFKKSEVIASDIADEICRSISTNNWFAAADCGAVLKELRLPVRKPSTEQIKVAEQKLSAAQFDRLELVDARTLELIYARELTLLAQYPERMPFVVQVLRIGDILIGGLSGEFFAETGLWLKQNSPAGKYFTIGLANGCVGYVPPAHEIEAGGYETWLCRTSCLAKDAEDRIKNELHALLGALWRNE